MPTSDHTRLREQIKQKRRTLDSRTREQNAHQLAALFTKTTFYQNSQHIAAYIPVQGECDPGFIIKTALATGKTVYLPIITADKTLKFAAYTTDTTLRPNRYGIPEPEARLEDRKNAAELDLICVPLVAFDITCNRLGMGGGYYDRTLCTANPKNHHTLYIGIAYEFQKVTTLTTNPWDIPMDHIITEEKLYSRTQSPSAS